MKARVCFAPAACRPSRPGIPPSHTDSKAPVLLVRLLKIMACCAALLAGNAMAQAAGNCSKGAANPTWQLLPRQGLTCGTRKVSLGMKRATLRKTMLAANFLPPKPSRFADEDDFLTPDESTFIRVRYQGSKVRDIEFLRGSLTYKGVNLHKNTRFAEVEKKFKAMKLVFRNTRWLGDGQDVPQLAINIATRENVGGDGDAIEWVILSSTFKN